MEAFHTLQGEGFHSGKPAYFIRLGGCDVGCVWCDVKESWDATQWPEQTIGEIVSGAKEFSTRLAVVTGGEPLMYDMETLTAALKQENFTTNVETSGAHPLTGTWDWICFSPKKFKEPRTEFYEAANELKIIVYNQSDFKWAEEHASKVNDACELFLQPEWDKSNQILPKVVDYVQEFPKWRISLQTHKFMNIP
jgi:organic radical activating enzyme